MIYFFNETREEKRGRGFNKVVGGPRRRCNLERSLTLQIMQISPRSNREREGSLSRRIIQLYIFFHPFRERERELGRAADQAKGNTIGGLNRVRGPWEGGPPYHSVSISYGSITHPRPLQFAAFLIIPFTFEGEAPSAPYSNGSSLLHESLPSIIWQEEESNRNKPVPHSGASKRSYSVHFRALKLHLHNTGDGRCRHMRMIDRRKVLGKRIRVARRGSYWNLDLMTPETVGI